VAVVVVVVDVTDHSGGGYGFAGGLSE
jgi:hypothetical protein